jgi:formamidopyrimidine-DNA glycosylase
VGRLGPEPFNLSAAAFAARLRARRGAVKPLLLNQSFLAGLGNIYADEALHRAGIHPLARASRIGAARATNLHAAIVEVLSEAIAAGGSSISDYADAEGRQGSFQRSHRVYGRCGEPCPNCGGAIRRIVAAQRSAHFCPACQRR